MIKIQCDNIENNKTKTIEIKKLDDIYTPSKEQYEVPNQTHTNILTKMDVNLSVLIPYKNGEDFIYQYSNDELFSNLTNFNNDIKGKKFKQVFRNIQELGIYNAMKRSYDNNTRVDLNISIHGDNSLIFATQFYYIPDENKLFCFLKNTTKFTQLKEEEHRLFCVSKEGLITISEDHKILRANHQFYKEIGYTPEEFKELGGFEWMLSHEITDIESADCENLNVDFEHLIHHTSSAMSFDSRYKNKNGEWEYLNVHAIPTRFHGQNAIQINITNLEDKKEEEKLFYRSKEGMITVSADQKVLRVNDKFFETIDLTREEFEELGGFEWMLDVPEIVDSSHADCTNLTNDFQRIINHKSSAMSFDIRYLDKDGLWIYLNAFCIPTKYANQDAIQIALTSLNEKRAEEILFYNSNEGLITLGEDREVLRVNDQFYKMIKYTPKEFEELGGVNWIFKNHKILDLETADCEDLTVDFDHLLNHISSSMTFNAQFPGKDKKMEYLNVHAIPTRYKNENAVQIAIANITELKAEEIEALNLQRNLLTIQEVSSTALSYLIDGEMIWTPQIYEILETEPLIEDKDNYIIKNFTIKEDLPILEENLNSLSKENPEVDFVIRVKTAEDNLKYLGILIKAQFDENGNMISRVGFNQDLTKTIMYEQELKNSLNELEYLTQDRKILLQEIHHRVKNNLQIILSLLNLELHYHPDNPENTIQQTRNRINTMALIHEQVYQSNDASHVNAEDYIIAGMSSLFGLYSTSNIHQHYDIEPIDISIEKSIPLCLILNELALNTIKHAFPNGEDGTFNIELSKIGDLVTVKVYDDGVGLPEDLCSVNSSLGFLIIENLVEQLEGNIELMKGIEGFGQIITFELNCADSNKDITVCDIND